LSSDYDSKDEAAFSIARINHYWLVISGELNFPVVESIVPFTEAPPEAEMSPQVMARPVAPPNPGVKFSEALSPLVPIATDAPALNPTFAVAVAVIVRGPTVMLSV